MLKLSNLVLLLFATSVLFGQEIEHPQKKYSEDSKMEVVNLLKSANAEDQVALFVEDQFIGNQVLYPTLNPDNIKSVEVEKEPFVLDSIHFDGKIIITYKDEYQPEYVSVKKLILEQTEIDLPIVVQIDKEVLDLDYAMYKVDKNFILKLTLEEIPTSKEGHKIVLAKFITKTPANIVEANNIHIK
ncbi:hypothetical protein [Zunongwangia sp. HGR-M22]|uniref:hypothetical protein n=1 Tax=Zunongwangia sp. HGR-M22 TaxID=3015168 RepID=UPI0022DE8377|nr:hypothetical protein [Zunongwangia sp. HGR-M22]WBL25143.1 hypothetical protein PBT91_14725 [Zunongwangia sp. HGR-M22]